MRFTKGWILGFILLILAGYRNQTRETQLGVGTNQQATTNPSTFTYA